MLIVRQRSDYADIHDHCVLPIKEDIIHMMPINLLETGCNRYHTCTNGSYTTRAVPISPRFIHQEYEERRQIQYFSIASSPIVNDTHIYQRCKNYYLRDLHQRLTIPFIADFLNIAVFANKSFGL